MRIDKRTLTAETLINRLWLSLWLTQTVLAGVLHSNPAAMGALTVLGLASLIMWIRTGKRENKR